MRASRGGSVAAPKPSVRPASRRAWRDWLARNHGIAREIWIVYRKAHTTRSRLTYAEAVEEALCFGWIDTTVRRLDADSYAQRFTPRSNTRNWSRINLARFDRLVSEGRMTEAGRAKRPERVAPPRRRFQAGDPVPADVRRALAKDAAARRNFEALAPGYRRDYVRWVTEAKRAETRERRLREAVRRLARNQKRVQEIGSRILGSPRPR